MSAILSNNLNANNKKIENVPDPQNPQDAVNLRTLDDAISSIISNNNDIIGEEPLGSINGMNNIYTTANNFIPNSLEVFVNGLKQKLVDDYNISGTTTIILTFSPNIGEEILVNYKF